MFVLAMQSSQSGFSLSCMLVDLSLCSTMVTNCNGSCSPISCWNRLKPCASISTKELVRVDATDLSIVHIKSWSSQWRQPKKSLMFICCITWVQTRLSANQCTAGLAWVLFALKHILVHACVACLRFSQSKNITVAARGCFTPFTLLTIHLSQSRNLANDQLKTCGLNGAIFSLSECISTKSCSSVQ